MADLKDPVRHPVKEVTVMGHHKDRPFVIPEIVLQPVDHLPVQMIRWLVQQKHIKVLCQRLRQHDPSLLPAGKSLDLLIKIHDTELHQIAFHLPLLSSPIVKCIRAYICSLREILDSAGYMRSSDRSGARSALHPAFPPLPPS